MSIHFTCIAFLVVTAAHNIQYLKTAINKENRPGGSDVEVIRNLKEDFYKRNLDENLITEIGDDFVMLSSARKNTTRSFNNT